MNMAAATPADVWKLGDYQKIAYEHAIISERLCAGLAITAGSRVLDVACGTGNTAIAAARRRAAVTAVDITPTLLDRARLRAEAEGVQPILFRVADAASLPFADDSFDFVLSTFGAVFLPDQVSAARELARVVRPGGTLALTAWARHSLPSAVYHLIQGMVPPPENAPPPAYIWTDGPRVDELLAAHSSSIMIGHDTYDSCFASAEEFFDNHARFYPPIIAALARVTEAQRASIRAGMIDIARAHNRATNGTLMVRYDYATIIAHKL